ncbi:efflux transporter outer membrane subunit [Mariprofundus erugo]|uniref:Efflux transporter outer membrane subunit n=1 Tax=Mariprofundus erugo TaxID=2528639 RepID=A0A5R9GG61_9PROT|nr:efflux transporter outer membrane subunit [Mariprofundus erugo]TLS65470.1 efflux transporter outer membrane subunit [Mariprofundus erugo]
MTRWHAFISLLSLSLLSACAAGPDFTRPEPSVPAAYTGPSDIRSVAGQTIAIDFESPGNWWQSLRSDRLDTLIEKAMAHNPDITAAKATLRQANELYAARSGTLRYPSADIGVSGQRQRFNPGSLGMPGGPREFSLYSANVGVRYSFDLAGESHRILESLAAKADFQRFELAGARLTIAANITLTALAEARLAARIASMNEVLAAQKEQLRIGNGQLRLGQISNDHLTQLHSDYDRTDAEVLRLREQWQETRHLLATLAGDAPSSPDIPDFRLDEFSLPEILPMVIPSKLVRRRPDILASEALMHAANAEYGAAVARLYPQLNLSATPGTQSPTMGGLFGPGTAVWSLMGQLSQPLFHPGIRAEKRAALAAFKASEARYQKSVLTSFREVADALRAVQSDAERFTVLSKADQAALSLVESSERQLKLGATSELQVQIARQKYATSKLPLIDVQTARLNDSVALLQAMAGEPPADEKP